MNPDIIRNVFLFIPQLFVCDIPFLVKVPKRNDFWIRLIVAVVAFSLTTLLLACIRSVLPGNEDYVIWHLNGIVYFTLIVFLNAFGIQICYDVKFSVSFFIACGGYSLEHMASRFSYIVQIWSFRGIPVGPAWEYFFFDMLVPVVFALVFYFAMIRRRMSDYEENFGDPKVLVVSALNLFICIVLSIFEPDASDGSIEMVLILSAYYLSAFVSCLLCLLVQLGFFHESRLGKKNRVLQTMLEFEQKKQRMSKETIEIINMKCHDLKHQISLLENQPVEKRSRSLKDISNAIMIYDSITKTGNQSVDLVLMEKKLTCDKYHIQFTYMVDGKKFSFMEETDIYAMLGNMMDNAIESVAKEPDVEKRIIQFVAYAKNDNFYICMDNYCSRKIVLKDGFPVTSKEDKNYHGFGLRSIFYIAKTYGGCARIKTESQHFVVEVLLPIPEESKEKAVLLE